MFYGIFFLMVFFTQKEIESLPSLSFTFNEVETAIQQTFIKMELGFEPKSLQTLALFAFLNGLDVFLNLPTGWGKSLGYMCASSVYFILTGGGSVLLVVEPLLHIIDEQVAYANSIGVTATHLNSEKDVLHAWTTNNLLYVTPEFLNQTQLIMELLENKSFKKLFRGFVFDEVHCVMKWVQGYRPDYKLLLRLRSFVPSAPSMGLSGSIHPSIREDIVRHLGYDSDYFLARISPNRDNIFFHNVVGFKHKEFNHLNSLLDLLATGKLQQNESRVLIFFESQDLCSLAYEYSCRHLGFASWSDKTDQIGMYHSATPAGAKLAIREDCKSKNPCMWLILCTASLQMGANVTFVRYVLFYGNPNDIDDYTQSFGRQRDVVKSGHAIILVGGSHRVSQAKASLDMRTYITIEEGECLREALLEFYEEILQEKPVNCCSHCNLKCSCDLCEKLGHFYIPIINKFPDQPVHIPLRVVNEIELRMSLAVLKNSYSESGSWMTLDLISGLPDAIMNEIVLNAPYVHGHEDWAQILLLETDVHRRAVHKCVTSNSSAVVPSDISPLRNIAPLSNISPVTGLYIPFLRTVRRRRRPAREDSDEEFDCHGCGDCERCRHEAETLD
eukprot:Lithocolla_globosa_v1_NODE_2014_length_2206_cov_7.820167.p1 type:complete len:614 gc:universal NODE_2014_length_2206_cov_7.820167:2030-189(-)